MADSRHRNAHLRRSTRGSAQDPQAAQALAAEQQRQFAVLVHELTQRFDTCCAMLADAARHAKP